jgi:hypothetical protein
MKLLTTLALLLPLAAQAQQQQCWVPYPGFEETVPHINLARCPGENLDMAEWVCRIVLRDDQALVYFFRHSAEAGMPCLVRVLRQDFNSFATQHGTTYREP